MSILGTTALRKAWAPACGPATSRVRIDLYGAGSITVRRECEAAFRALNDCLRAANYRTRKADTGAYNCRKITGGTGYSLHAYGIAADLNWQTNPYGRRLVTDMPKSMREAIKAIRTNNGKQVFGWGGDYRTNKDAMHYEVVCTPADLATGIAGKPAAAPDPNEGRKWHSFKAGVTDGQLYKAGYRNDEVSELQLLLKKIGLYKAPVNGTYDPATVTALINFKDRASWVDESGKKDRSSVVTSKLIAALRTIAAAA